jgi:hypothetical protein
MFQYRRTTNASRRTERKIKYLHVSAQVVSLPQYDASGKLTHVIPILSPHRETFDIGRNKDKRANRQVTIKRRVAARSAR